MQDCYHMTSGPMAIIRRSHIKLIYLAERGHSMLKDVGINGGEPQNGEHCPHVDGN